MTGGRRRRLLTKCNSRNNGSTLGSSILISGPILRHSIGPAAGRGLPLSAGIAHEAVIVARAAHSDPTAEPA